MWQLGNEIRISVLRLTARPRLATRFKARDQINDATNSVCRNIAEGFSAESHGEFVRYLGIARNSLNELLDSLEGARLEGLVSNDDLAPIQALARRQFKAMSTFIAYLIRSDKAHRLRRKQARGGSDRAGTGTHSPDRTDKR